MMAKCLYFSVLLHCCLAAQINTPGGLARNAVEREQDRSARQVAPGKSPVVYCDQYSSLRACHEALPATGGMMMLPPNTVFTLVETLNITKPNVFLAGSGIGSSVIQRHPTLRSGDLVSAWGTGFRLTGVTIDGNRVSHLAEELGIFGSGALIDGIEVRNNAHIAIAVATSSVKITNSSVVGLGSTDTGSMGIWFDSSRVSDLVISDNVIKQHRLNGIFGSGRNIEISRNYLSGNHCQVYPTGGGQIAIKGVATNSNISIVGNTLDPGGGPATSGLEIDGPGVNIVWNRIRGQARYGIILQSGFGHQVVGNTVVNSGTALLHEAGIHVSAGITGFQILGNRAYDDQSARTQSWGVRVEPGPSADYTIAGNDLRGNINTPGIIDGGFGANRQVYGNL